jgi:predicted component of type VI protein secretion system
MPEVLLLSAWEGERGAESAPLPVTHFPCVLGRHTGCDLFLGHPMVSRRHCALSLRDGRVWVEDLGSRNGTRLNGQPLATPRPLEDGDQLEVAHLPFRVRFPRG